MKVFILVFSFLFVLSCSGPDHTEYDPPLEEKYTVENTDEEDVELQHYSDSDYFSVKIMDIFSGYDGFSDKTFTDGKGNYYYTRQESKTDESRYLVKKDSDGNIVWEKKFLNASGSSHIYITALTEPEQDIIIVGNAQKRFVTKINSDGDQIWIKDIEVDNGYLTATSVATDSKGNVYVSGYVQESTYDMSDGFLGKWNKDGTLQWAKQSEMKYSDVYNKVIVDDKDNLYLTGTENVNGEYMYYSDYFGASMFIAKLNSDGKEIWKTTSRLKDDIFYGIDITISDDSLIFLGQRCELVKTADYDDSDSYETDDSEVSDDDALTGMHCFFHPFLRKYGLDGKKVWEKDWKGREDTSSNTTAISISVIDEKIYTVLFAWAPNGGNSDTMISIFNKDGSHYISQIIESDCSDYPGQIFKGLNDEIIVTGISDGWIGENISEAQCECEMFKPFVLELKPKE